MPFCRRLNIEDYDASTYGLENTLFNITAVTEQYEIIVVRSYNFGQCYTMIPK